MSVTLGAKFNCNYTNEECLRGDPDVQIISSSGKVFGINRMVLVCSTPVSTEFLKKHWGSSVWEETVHVTTDFGDPELEALMNFCFTGALPMTADKALDMRFAAVFHAFGLDLNYLADPTAVIKTEPVEPVYEGPIGDYYGEDFLQQGFYEEDESKDLPILPLVQQGSKKKARKIIKEEDDEYIASPIPMKKRKKIKLGNTAESMKTKRARQGKSKDDPKTFFYFPNDLERDFDLKYQCRRCVRGFNELYDYRQHYMRHEHGKEDRSKAFCCLRCYQFFSSNKKEVIEHGKDGCNVKRHEDDKSAIQYYCVFCPEGGTDHDTSIEWLQHLKRHHPTEEARLFREHQCGACGKGWKGDYLLEKHRKLEGPYHREECNTCGLPVASWEDHQKHIKEKHDNKWVFKCGLCGVCKFETDDEERGHRKFCKHSQQKDFS